MGENIIEELISQPLSSDHVIQLAGGNPVVLMYDRVTMADLDKHARDGIIMLYQSKDDRMYGHWTCIFQQGRTIHFYDSYGVFPDDEFRFEAMRKANPIVTKWLLSRDLAGYRIEYNEHPHQARGSTCGRHVGMRLRYRYLDCKQYNEFLSLLRDRFGIHDTDNLISILSSLYI